MNLLCTNCFAGCVVTRLSNLCNSSSALSYLFLVLKILDGLKSNSGLSAVGLPSLNLSKIYSLYRLGSKNLIRLPSY